MDAVALKKPGQVPVVVLFGIFACRYAGIDRKGESFNLEKSYEANLKATMDFEPDMASAPLTFPSVLGMLDNRQPSGYGLPDDYGYQYVEKEYMRSEEYDSFLFDPSDFLIRQYWPRTLGRLSGFNRLPPIHTLLSYFNGLPSGLASLASPQGFEALDALKKAAEEAAKSRAAFQGFAGSLAEAGFPMFFASGTQAPFDILSDYLRGTRGVILDMYRRPQQVVAACEKLLPMMLESVISEAGFFGNPRVFIPLHKGSDNFMSPDQFKKYYWPTLRELLLALIQESLTPILFMEGPYDSRLEIIRDVPEGKIIYWFENVDMAKAGKILGGRVCIMGNVPISLLSAGTEEQVENYCNMLLRSVGKDGGYIMSAGAVLDEARIENVRILMNITRAFS